MLVFPRLPRFISTLLRVAVLALMLGLTLAPRSARAEGPLDQEAREIGKDLQCPICENQSVQDSPSELAGQMRGIIRDQLAAGKSRKEIEDYFVARYGEAVLRNPPKEGINLLVWFVPPAVLLVGAGLVFRMLRRNVTGPRPAGDDEVALTDQERERYERLLEHEVHSGAEVSAGDSQWRGRP